ncbi:bile acid:sodium symporter family protein [Neolewinella aurantiaca]|uniref:Bile acid:sodium symporter family protein n=1 Tax=Neolewinella aurantiaca TaxID=2602767 RepID=A0A5C7FR20_9BACT|nr:bile acid:sodium symporter family protein [Neolewinella aurantiaca]TXF87854.1 bile acid:sodium symporter family protein [Neolewinella aurantiaca]
MIDFLIGLILALIMFSIGLSLKTDNFRQLASHPRVLLLGLGLQLLLLPAIAFSVAFLFKLPPAFAAGVVILSACPGGLSSNFISFLLKANTTLAVSLTICNTSLSMLTIPVIVNLGLATFWTGEGLRQLPLLPTAGQIFLIVLVPVISGMIFRARRTARAEYLQPRLRWLSLFLLGTLFALKLLAPADAGGSNLLISETLTILPASLAVNACALLSGFLFGRLFGFGRNDQITLGVEAGIQNTSLAFLITSALLENEQMLKPALVYAMFTFFTGLAYGLWLKPGMWNALRKEWRLLKFFE